MSNIIETIDVDIPVRDAYDQWIQFEESPELMDDIDAVYQRAWSRVIAGQIDA